MNKNTISSQKNRSYPIGTRIIVQKMYNQLSLSKFISSLKYQGVDINALVQMMLTFRMQSNNADFSIVKCINWANSPEILKTFGISPATPICERTFYRVVETLGKHLPEIMCYLQEQINQILPPSYKSVYIDWTTKVLWGLHSDLGTYGHSKEKRDDKHQITIGSAITSSPYYIPLSLTVESGNTNDKTNCWKTLEDISQNVPRGKLIVFDRGAYSNNFLEDIMDRGYNYLTGMLWNKSLVEFIQSFKKSKDNCLNPEEPNETKRVYCEIQSFPSRYNFIYFSDKRKNDDMTALREKETRLYEKKHRPKSSPKKQANDTTKQELLVSEEKKTEEIEREVERKKTGKEGYFVLCSNIALDPRDALKYYREKDAVEKLFYSLKNEINPGPIRVWKENSIKGTCLIIFLVYLFLAVAKVFFPELTHKSMRNIIRSLKNLMVTYVYRSKKNWKEILSNFDSINRLIFEWNIKERDKSGGTITLQ